MLPGVNKAGCQLLRMHADRCWQLMLPFFKLYAANCWYYILILADTTCWQLLLLRTTSCWYYSTCYQLELCNTKCFQLLILHADSCKYRDWYGAVFNMIRYNEDRRGCLTRWRCTKKGINDRISKRTTSFDRLKVYRSKLEIKIKINCLRSGSNLLLISYTVMFLFDNLLANVLVITL